MMAKKSFSILIIGAGIAGLAAAVALTEKGHKVTILEAAPKLSAVGAGIQLPPNSVRVLKRLGLYDEIAKLSSWPKAVVLKRWKDGSVITQMPLQPGLEQLYGSPYLLIHRADLHTVLLDKAYAVGVDIKLNSYVSAIHEAEPSVSLGDGTKLGADLVIGADGLKSNVRKAVLGGQDVRINFSPSCVYRTLVPASAMKSNPLLRPLIDDPEAIYWLGPSGHIIGYPISNGTMYNFVLCDSSTPPVGLVPETVQLSEIQARFHDWEPVVRQLVDLVTSPLKWQLAEVEEPPSWVSPSGNVAMIGDASHAMVPHLAQGAAMALEDACALAVCVDRARGDAKDLPALMGHFERIRRGRCYHILREAAQLGQMWHLADGPGQMTRDKQMQESSARLNRDWEKQKQAQAWNPNRWDDAEFQPMLFGHDAEQEATTYLDLHHGVNGSR